MGCCVLKTAVRLDLDDPTNAILYPGFLPDQHHTDRACSGFEHILTEGLPRDAGSVAGASGQEKTDVTSEGKIPPKNSSTNGTMLFRTMSAVTEP